MAFITVSVAALLIFVIFSEPEPAIERIAHKEHRVTALAELLAKNNVMNLPSKFNFWGSNSEIEYFEAENVNGDVFRLVKVIYPFNSGGSRGYSFIFNDTGKCVFWSKDLRAFLNGGLLDITDDGNIEKAVLFFTGDIREDGLTHRFQVFRIGSDSSEKLLDVGYKFWTGEHPDDFIGIDIIPSEASGQLVIEISRTRKPQDNVTFKWSSETQSFVTESPEYKYWKMFPTEEKIWPSSCPFHPQITLGKLKTCPICGYPGKEK